jgi:Fur family ferric uptake transcriptional regulator
MEDTRTWTDHARAELARAGHRSGGARAHVLDLLADHACCRSAQELHDELRAGGRAVGLASVYRALDTLADLRLVKRIDAGDGIARYERLHPDGDHHHHLVCRDCGKVEAFSDQRLERAIDRAAGSSGYTVDEHEIVLTGACSSCS